MLAAAQNAIMMVGLPCASHDRFDLTHPRGGANLSSREEAILLDSNNMVSRGWVGQRLRSILWGGPDFIPAELGSFHGVRVP